MHASPVEHQATPIHYPQSDYGWEEGITHIDRNMDFWSGNFRDWIQHRKMLPNECKK
jgi:hypothetical protein